MLLIAGLLISSRYHLHLLLISEIQELFPVVLISSINHLILLTGAPTILPNLECSRPLFIQYTLTWQGSIDIRLYMHFY